MGQMVNLTASDGHQLGAYMATPAGEAKGAMVVIQEIFGVNPHIKRVTDSYAAEGYVAIAPALFDRFKRDIELKYTGLDAVEAMALRKLLTTDSALKDVAAAFKHVSAGPVKVGIVGFCFGGFMSWIAACRGASEGIAPGCCVCYYPGGIGGVAEEQPACPVMIHIGADDSHIGQDQIDQVKAAHPEIPLYLYADAQHGFNCDARDAYNPAQAAVARERTLDFLKQYIG